MEVWENEKCCGNTSRRQVFPQLYQVFPNFHECFYSSIETQKTCFLFLLENTVTEKRKPTWYELWLSKCKLSLLAPWLCQQLVLVLCFYWVMETQFFYPISVHIFLGLNTNVEMYMSHNHLHTLRPLPQIWLISYQHGWVVFALANSQNCLHRGMQDMKILPNGLPGCIVTLSPRTRIINATK